MGAASAEEEWDATLLRSRVYGFIRRIVSREVDGALLAWCRGREQERLWSGLGLDLAGVLEAGDPEDLLEELAVDFCRLFVTSGAAGSPHESLHTSEAPAAGAPALLWGDPASAVKRFYRDAGFELSEGAHRLPDALAVELEFMERLSGQEAAAREQGRSDEVRRLAELQRRFLREHLGRWVPPYGRMLKEHARTDFYRAMLELAAEFVEWDARERGGRA